ncbi:MAG: DNA photolyase family protein [Crocinitomicaceae bacterium]|nr:DNA photolyase family protein [Crocinitomicaceae bacterium]
MYSMEVTYFWFRRDLRIADNTALYNALNASKNVQCIFIFDNLILSELPKDDARVSFIYKQLASIDQKLSTFGSSIRVELGNPVKIWEKILREEIVDSIYTNKDYEPYARKRDGSVRDLCDTFNVKFHRFKDQVIFEESEILKKDGKPYTVYTPFKNSWLKKFNPLEFKPISSERKLNNLRKKKYDFPSIVAIGFTQSRIKVKDFTLDNIKEYSQVRDIPFEDKTSYLSPHLRFGTIGIRTLIHEVKDNCDLFISELIWREFFMQILYHFPKVVTQSFRQKYDQIPWRNNQEEFTKWCNGKTGYPMVDAGMRQLNETGYMHNRVRMITASFLCKHLLIDWRWGEAYFAKKLLDFDLASNNGNWQWAAGTGCDAAPYFRVFNPTIQLTKFDKELKYIRHWIKEFDEISYPVPMVEHSFARKRAINTYKEAIS